MEKMQPYTNLFIEKPSTQGRRFVVGDIHGCRKTFKSLLFKKFQLHPQDQLFLLGDYVNRGTDSLGVLQDIMELQTSGYQIFPLRGNHEQMLIEKLDRKEESHYTSIVHQLDEKQGLWLNALPYYYILDRFYLVHGAINTQVENPLEDLQYMLWQRKTLNPSNFLQGKQLIYGHTKNKLTTIWEAIEDRLDCIPLDNGCYMGCQHRAPCPEEYGYLCGLDLDRWYLYVQKNED
ncbi:MAG: serine/threonine protein phosphatase [Cytophagales bacterium]|nr:MAG: serine/threonine protein phosphatase [Cytophagales bacterium]